ncbi:MAG: hypothetical protein NT061_00635 [Spirochaetes bacterium]|nr:hypothetical protein [Spirochaetota bacterium]
MANISLRGCDEELSRAMKQVSVRKGMSVNRLILETLRESLLSSNAKKRRHDDLDYLAGTWNEEEARTFDLTVADFEKIDEDLWTGEQTASQS